MASKKYYVILLATEGTEFPEQSAEKQLTVAVDSKNLLSWFDLLYWLDWLST